MDAEAEPDLEAEAAVSSGWSKLVGALSGLLCTSLVLLDDGAHHVGPGLGPSFGSSFIRAGRVRSPASSGVFRYGMLPLEQVGALRCFS